MSRPDEVSQYFINTAIWQKLRKLVGRYDAPKRFLLTVLLGKKSYIELLETFTEEDKQLCEMLLGPNGYTVYKMLLARHGLEDKDYVPQEWYEDADGRRCGNPETALLKNS